MQRTLFFLANLFFCATTADRQYHFAMAQKGYPETEFSNAICWHRKESPTNLCGWRKWSEA